MKKRNYYMVRAMLSREHDFKVFTENNVVAVGWSNVKFNSFKNSEDLKSEVNTKYYEFIDKAPQTVSRNLNEVVRFKNFKNGDYIIVPFYSSILLAVATGQEIYDEKYLDQDLSNQHKVKYICDVSTNIPISIPRNELTEGLQRRLRVRGTTVSNLFEFKDEIEKLFSSNSYSYLQEMQSREKDERDELKKGLLENIRSGKTYLAAGGRGLELLVEELMKCEGYETKVLRKTEFPDKADADVLALKDDAFMSKKIFVQVKHHSGYSNKEGIQQVLNVLKLDEFMDYEGYFVTTAKIDDSVKQFASNNNIECMDGESLVELIINNIDKLEKSTLRKLGISSYPSLIL